MAPSELGNVDRVKKAFASDFADGVLVHEVDAVLLLARLLFADVAQYVIYLGWVVLFELAVVKLISALESDLLLRELLCFYEGTDAVRKLALLLVDLAEFGED